MLSAPDAPDTVPLTLDGLSEMLDWRSNPSESSTLYKIASVIWHYLPPSQIEEYTINFAHASENKLIGWQPTAPPVLVTSSPNGDILLLVECIKFSSNIEYEEKIHLLILYPTLSDCKYFDCSTVETDNGQHCTFWEIDQIEQITHLVMDKYGIIYFSDGESIYRIMKNISDNMYLDIFENIYTSSNDTSHITSIWRQQNDIYFSLQDWDNETNIDIYKLRPLSTTSEMEKKTKKKIRKQSAGYSPRIKHRAYSSGSHNAYSSGSEIENEFNEYFNKLRTFTLQYNQRIWQLGTLLFSKKYLMAIGAAQMGNMPTLLQIGFKSDIKVLHLMGEKGKNKENILWPKSITDEKIPHGIYQHKQTKTWFCIIPIINKKKFYWIQFKFNSNKKQKIIWQRLIPIPDHDENEGEWLYYDEIRDVLVGYKGMDRDKNEYVFKYLPDMTKYLWIESDDDKTNKIATMQRLNNFNVQKMKKPPKKPSLSTKNSKDGDNTNNNKQKAEKLTLSKQNNNKNKKKENKPKKRSSNTKQNKKENKKESQKKEIKPKEIKPKESQKKESKKKEIKPKEIKPKESKNKEIKPKEPRKVREKQHRKKDIQTAKRRLSQRLSNQFGVEMDGNFIIKDPENNIQLTSIMDTDDDINDNQEVQLIQNNDESIICKCIDGKNEWIITFEAFLINHQFKYKTPFNNNIQTAFVNNTDNNDKNIQKQQQNIIESKNEYKKYTETLEYQQDDIMD